MGRKNGTRTGVDLIAQMGTEICLSVIDLSKTVIYTKIDMPEASLRLGVLDHTRRDEIVIPPDLCAVKSDSVLIVIFSLSDHVICPLASRS